MSARKVKSVSSSRSSGNGAAVAETPPKPTSAPATAASVPSMQSSGETSWWFDARGVKSSDTELFDAVADSNCSAVLVGFEQRSLNLSKQKVVAVDRAAQIDQLDESDWIYTADEELLQSARAAGRKGGLFVEVQDMESEFPRCVALCKRGYDVLVIDIHDATYIPYELLLAETENTPTRLLRSVPIKGLQGTVDEVNQSLNAFATMERGVGVLFKPKDAAEVRELTRKMRDRTPGKLSLVEAEVIEVGHRGLGHRVCVDTTTLMSAEEGMIIGSTGWGGIFVCSETHYLPHMNLREFRVNAGGVHSYVWCPSDRHIYLSELQAGHEVLVVDVHGNARVATVGRVKIERRPLLWIKARIDLTKVPEDVANAVETLRRAAEVVTPEGEKIDVQGKYVFVNTFLQNDWHVRVMGADHKVRHSTLVRPGESLLAHVDIPGRHTGLRVSENIVEK